MSVIPQKRKEFLGILGPDDDIARFEYLKKNSKTFGTVLLGIETSKPENFKKLFSRLSKKGFDFEDITDNHIYYNFIV